MNGDQMEYELNNQATPPKERPDWPLPSSDPNDWAEAFCKIATNKGIYDINDKPLDVEWLVTWFANAMQRGRDDVLRTNNIKKKMELAVNYYHHGLDLIEMLREIPDTNAYTRVILTATMQHFARYRPDGYEDYMEEQRQIALDKANEANNTDEVFPSDEEIADQDPHGAKSDMISIPKKELLDLYNLVEIPEEFVEREMPELIRIIKKYRAE